MVTESSYDKNVEYLVGALLQMYARKNINNLNLSSRIDNIEEKRFENSVYEAVKNFEPLMKDISETDLRGSKFFVVSLFFNENFNKKLKGKILQENPAMIELRDKVVPKILEFKFDTWYMMNNENYGFPYKLDPEYLDLNGGNPSTLCEIYNVGKTFLSLREFHENIKSEYEGDFSEFK